MTKGVPEFRRQRRYDAAVARASLDELTNPSEAVWVRVRCANCLANVGDRCIGRSKDKAYCLSRMRRAQAWLDLCGALPW